jgi:DNA repair protein RecN (Recombination protein N)
MLRTLRILDLAVIEEISVEFGPGLNLLTGETGAGKSILVDALGLIAGARSDAGLVRAGADRARVEGVFDVPPDSEVRDVLAESGLPEDEDQLVIRREVNASGGGRAFVNDAACTVAIIRRLAGSLIDLLGQHEHHGLLAREAQRDLLDRYGGHGDPLAAVRATYREVVNARQRMEALRSRADESERRAERLRDEIREIDAVAPSPGELDAVDRERTVLANAGRIAELVEGAVEALYAGESSSSSLAARAGRSLEELAAIDPDLGDLCGRLEAARVEIEDVGQALRDYRDTAAYDPRRLETLESRRAALEALRLRFGRDEDEVLRHRERASEELAGLEMLRSELRSAADRVSEGERRYRDACRTLSRSREKVAARLGPEVERTLRDLAFGKARFRVALEPAPGPTVEGGSAGEDVPFSPSGAESAEYLLAPNPGEPERPLRRIASGGELSRVMLALHGVLEDPGSDRVLVFDEVDAGVGGAVADSIGARLRRLAEHHQVLCVTHLPQVAAHADRHYSVTKRVDGGRTRAGIAGLDPQARIEELARMLGGRKVSAASRKNAAELIRAARSRRADAGRTS